MFLSHFLTGSKPKTEHHLIHTFSNVIFFYNKIPYFLIKNDQSDNFESDFENFRTNHVMTLTPRFSSEWEKIFVNKMLLNCIRWNNWDPRFEIYLIN
jgi:hypothetical protein